MVSPMPFSISCRPRRGAPAVFFALAAVVLACGAAAQSPSAARSVGSAGDNPDGKVVGVDTAAADAAGPRTREQLTGDAWEMLAAAVQDEKHADVQIQALAALGTLGANAKSVGMIAEAFRARDVDVRTAAVLASGQTHSASLTAAMRKALDDPEPQVAFAAATTLWKMGDHSGEDLLLAVVDGDRKATAGLMHGSMHQANREMHDPAALTRLGAETGASLLLGPFGFGVTAYEYVRKNGGDSSRVQAVEDISRDRTPAARKTLQAALSDKDQGVRAAAAKGMRSYHDPEAQKALAALFTDPKKPVALSAAAAYLVSAGAVAMPPLPRLP
jgi:HEAT repeat protein